MGCCKSSNSANSPKQDAPETCAPETCAPKQSAPHTMGDLNKNSARSALNNDEIMLKARDLGNGVFQSEFSVALMHCGGCLVSIERAVGALDFVDNVRANLSARRVSVTWQRTDNPLKIVEAIAKAGFECTLYEPNSGHDNDGQLRSLLLALGVSGFAAGNIMLLSVSVWSGAEAATRDLFHWISALIAAPVIIYCGQVFFRSAWSALRVGRLNMDVPISLAVILAFLMSFYEVLNHGQETWFDAAVTLLFFLLAGRTLDHMMRARARQGVASLAKLIPSGAKVLGQNGELKFTPLDYIECGDVLRIMAGERVPLDGEIIRGQSDLDCALISGESEPQFCSYGAQICAGSLNLTGSIDLRVLKAKENSFLTQMLSLMEAASSSKARYRRIADRAASLYAPLVHLAALFTFIGWAAVTGDFHRALYTAIAVLIITCPCALGIAVPIVQVVAAGRLFARGILMKDGSALERLALVTCVVFDKTGTLTTGNAQVVERKCSSADFEIARAMAAHSNHPLSRAIAGGTGDGDGQISATLDEIREIPATLDEIKEIPGCGIEAQIKGRQYRLGARQWAAGSSEDIGQSLTLSEVVLACEGEIIGSFCLSMPLRAGASSTLLKMQAQGLGVSIVSGDKHAVVANLAQELNVAEFHSEVLPGGKMDIIKQLQQKGDCVLMIGDGINDAPALSQADVSISPSEGADVGRAAADFVFLHQDLDVVLYGLDIAKKARALILQNFSIAIAYNLIAVPIAVLGYASPLIAAIAMSSSSLLVIANALRLERVQWGRNKRVLPDMSALDAAALPRVST